MFAVRLLFSNNKCWYVIGVILYFPIFNVGSTVNGRYSIGLQQKYLKSLSYRSVAKIESGCTNIADESCFFVVRPFLTFFLNSILWIISDRLFLQPATLSFLVRSFTCCRLRGMCPTLEQIASPPRSSCTIV